MKAGSVLDVSNVVQRMMEELHINGSYDVRWNGSRSTGWVGSPTGTDYAVTVTIELLPEAGDGPV